MALGEALTQARGCRAGAHPAKQLVGATVLVLGAGDIGSSFARLVCAIGARAWGVRHRVAEPVKPFERLLSFDQLEEVLPQVDVVASVLPADHPLWRQPNALVTPHISGGWHLQATVDNMVALCRDNLKAYLADQPLRNVVGRKPQLRGNASMPLPQE